MSNGVRLRVMGLLALLFVALGVGWSVRSLARVPGFRRRLRMRQRDLKDLSKLAASDARNGSALRAYEALALKRAPPLRDVLAAVLPGGRPEIRELAVTPVFESWTLCRSEVVFEDLALTQLPSVFAALEACRPPWRLVKYDIKATPGKTGRGRVLLALETIEQM